MRITLLGAGTLLAISLLLNGVARADDDIRLVSNYDVAETDAAPASVAANYAADMTASEAEPAPPCGGCGTCDQCTSCNECNGGLRGRLGSLFQRSCDLPVAMPCPHPIGGYGFSGVDSFRGITNGNYPGNNGVVSGANLGGRILEDYGIGWQAGGSYGVYNFSGSASTGSTSAMQQGFLTTGLFRRADADHRFSWGIVHDWMFTNNFGGYGNSPTLAQFRGQAAWAMSAWNQVGVWATLEDRYVTRGTGTLPGTVGTPIAYQAIDQLNAFWDHQYGAFGATSRFSLGVPLNNRLIPPGFTYGGTSPVGAIILSTNWNAPITSKLSLYANAMYMKANASPGALAASAEFWNVSMGLQFSPGGNLRSKTIAGRTWMPYLPIANNSNFLVDARSAP